MFNLQTCLLLIFLIYLISNNWLNISVFNKITTSFIIISKLTICFFLFYYFSEILHLEKESDLYIYFNQALKLEGSLVGNKYSILKIILGNEENFNLTLSQLSLWERDFDYGLPNDNKTMIKIHLFLNLFLGKSIINHVFFFTLVSMTSLLLLIKQLKPIVKNHKILFLLTFLPSLLIWANGTYKESIAISIHLLIITTLLKFNSKINLKHLIHLALLCFIHLFVKPIYLFIIIPFLLCLIIYKLTHFKKWVNRLSIIIGTSSLMLFSLYNYKSNVEKDEFKYGNKINLLKMIEYKQDDFFYEAYHHKAKTLVKLTPLKTLNYSVIKSSFEAISNAFSLPSLFYPHKIEAIPFIIENLILYTLLFLILINYKKVVLIPEDKFLLLSGIAICFFSGIITPVLGVLIKFKSLGYIYLFIGLIKINFQKTSNE